MTRRRAGARGLAGFGGGALAERDFRRYWVGMVASEFALQMATVAIGWQVYAIRGNPLDLGLVGLCEFLPLPLLALPAGHVADRLPRRAVMACACVLNIGVSLGLLAVTLAGSNELWPFFALAFATGMGTAIGAPAGRALAPSLVPAEKLAGAIAIRSVGWQGAIVVGPALGGVLFSVRAELVYIVAGGLMAASLVSILAIDAGRAVVAEETTPGIDSLLAGIRLIRRTPVLFGAISLDLFAVLFGGAVALLPVFAKDVLHIGPAGLGLLRTAPAVGALVAGLVLARRPVGRIAGRKLLAVVALFGASMIVFGLSRAMWLSLLALVASGAADMVSVVLRQTIAPLVTPDELRGRVNAVEMVFISASNELGAFESGVAAALVGAVPAVVAGGVATVVVAVAWRFVFPQLARVDRVDELRPVMAEP